MLSGLRHKYDDVRGKGFFAQTRREVIPHGHPSISRSGSVRSEQRSLGEKDLPPSGLRRIWPVASLLVGYSPMAGDAPSSRLATGQIGRNERHRIYASDHLVDHIVRRRFEPDILVGMMIEEGRVPALHTGR